MEIHYAIHLFLAFICFFILISVYHYLDELKDCACFIENQHPKYKVNISYLKFYQILEIVALVFFMIILFLYKEKWRKIEKIDEKNTKWVIIISAIILLFITGLMSYYSIIMYFMTKKDCECINKWQKYIIYIQGAFNSIYFLRILFLFVFVFLLMAYNYKT